MLATEPMETIHLYYEPEEPQAPQPGNDLWVILFSLMCFTLILLKVCSIPPSLETITVPAHFLPLTRFSVAEKIMPTGVKVFPATRSNGIITIYNAAFGVQQLPLGTIITSQSAVEFITDEAVSIPEGNPPSYGVATVSVHAVVPGIKGNIPAYGINQIYASSLFVRNLTAFTGGRDAYSVHYITQQDRQEALATARAILSSLVSQRLLATPCSEVVNSELSVVRLVVKWSCQYVTYTPPVFFKTVGIEVKGKNLLLMGYYVARPRSVLK